MSQPQFLEGIPWVPMTYNRLVELWAILLDKDTRQRRILDFICFTGRGNGYAIKTWAVASDVVNAHGDEKVLTVYGWRLCPIEWTADGWDDTDWEYHAEFIFEYTADALHRTMLSLAPFESWYEWRGESDNV